MVLFAYKEDSFLNNNIIRKINYIILGIILLGAVMVNDSDITMPFIVCLIIPIATSALSYEISRRVISKTQFYEWDYTERQKKFRFITGYFLLCTFFYALFAFSVVNMYLMVKHGSSLFTIVISALPMVFFLFNLCNIVSLYYPLFEDDLTVAYKIQKKPTNWKDNGKEITSEDEFEDIMRRDFGVHL